MGRDWCDYRRHGKRHGDRDATEDIPEDPPRLDSGPSRALAKSAKLSVQDRSHTRDDAAGAHSRRSAWSYASLVRWPSQVLICVKGRVLGCKLGAPLRARSNTPAEVVAKMGNGTWSTIKRVMYDNARELVAGRMREYCEHKGIRINSSVPSNGVAERLACVATTARARCCVTQTPRRASGQRG